MGQINSGVGAVTTSTTKVPASWEAWLGNNATNRYQVTNTVYDLPAAGIDLLLAQNPSTLRNRVSFSSITPGQKGSEPVYSTYYNYDIEGNVSSLLQDYGSTGPMHDAGQQYKRIDYGYDLVSGKVNSVSYQAGKPDAFMHFYRYDAENRLTDVYTTADSVTVEHEAHYEYYKHGPLARALIGQNQVQGLDYAYTLQGWLKAVNGTSMANGGDMGQDGNTFVPSRRLNPKDAYGFSLHYYEGDYQPINPLNGIPYLTNLKTKLDTSYRGLYNGNISSMAVNIGILNNPKLYNYRYDQLNRLTGMDAFNGTNTGINLWSDGLTATNDYQERASYDANGNILSYTRNGYGATQGMDNLNYHYNPGTNQLNHIEDAVASGNYPNDLDNQSADNYTYDAAGNLITDQQAGITTPMTWSVYGKLLTTPSKNISYTYDAAGNRIGKTVGSTTTWYVRDAQGNILTTYSGEGMAMQERDLYGSSRLGTITNPAALSTTPQYLDHLGSGTLFTFTRGQKLFELTNHLGNVLATVSDKKFGAPVTGIPSQIAYYTADVKSAQDYYPFGQTMPGRTYNNLPRYTFNGKEYDAETGYQDYGMRMYDGVRFISPDPLTKTYPGLTPYQFASNSPILGIDKDGKEFAMNKWLFDIWLEWEFGDPTGAKTLTSGIEQKVAIQNQQTSYNNANVPKPVQTQLNQINSLQANAKIAAGTSQVIAFNIKTSFDIISSVAPIGEGISVGLKGTEIVYDGIRAERVLVGSSEKIAVIGRDFDARVLKFATAFKKQTGKTIETFQASDAAKAEWGQLLTKFNANVPDNIAKASQIFKENSAWAEKVKKEGYKVIDTGLGTKDAKGTFYKMETKSIFGD